MAREDGGADVGLVAHPFEMLTLGTCHEVVAD